MINVNDVIKVEASASLGSPSCNARVSEFAVLGERDLGIPSTLNVIYAECDDGFFVCVTESSPHYVVDDIVSSLS